MSHTPIQRTLFKQYDRLSPDQVMQTAGRHVPLFSGFVNGAWESLRQYRESDPDFADWDEGGCADFMTRVACTRARRCLAGEKGYRIYVKYGKLAIVVEEKLAFILKKLTWRRRSGTAPWRLTRSNYRTPRSVELYSQSTGDDLPECPRIVFGYYYRKEITEARFVLAYPRSGSRYFEWVYPITNEEDGTLGVFSLPPGDDGQDDKGYTVEPNTSEGTGTEKGPD